MLGSNEPMNSQLSGSEEQFASMACAKIRDRRVPHERVSGGDTVAGDDLEHARWDVFLRELYKPKQGQRRLLHEALHGAHSTRLG